MRRIQYLGLAVLGAMAVAGGPARAASCKAEHMMCSTAMPAGGYCECTARGVTESGTVVDQAMSRRPTNSTAGGCGAHPNAPGCR